MNSDTKLQPEAGVNQQDLPVPKSDTLYYSLAAVLGTTTGVVNVYVADLLFTALFVTASCMLLGVLCPRRPWRWVVIVGVCIPIIELLAYVILTQKPYRADIWESFLAFLPGIAGAYGGSIMRRVIDNILQGK